MSILKKTIHILIFILLLISLYTARFNYPNYESAIYRYDYVPQFIISISLFLKQYVIIPVVISIACMSIFIIIQLIKEKKLTLNFDELVVYLLTFYLIAFKFIDLYHNGSTSIYTTITFFVVWGIIALVYFLLNFKKYSLLKLVIYGLLCISIIFFRDFNLVIIFALSCLYIKLGVKQYLRNIFISIVFLAILTLVLATFNVVDTLQLSYRNPDNSVMIRSGLGFSHPNTVGLFLLISIMSFCLYKKLSIFEIVCFIVTICAVFYCTRSKAGCILSFGLVLLNVISRYFRKTFKITNLITLSFPVFTLITVAITVIWGQNDENIVNIFFSKRLSIMNHYLSDNWITFLGVQSVNIVDYPIDNLYLNIILVKGMFVYSIYCMLYVIFAYRLIRKKDFMLTVAVVAFFIYSMFEAILQNYFCSILPVFFFIIEIKKDNVKNCTCA